MKEKIIYCGSCGKPMKLKEDFGTETDGTASTEFCHLCYQNGAWTDPDISFEDFYEKSYKGFIESDMNKMQKFFLKKMYTKKIRCKFKKMERNKLKSIRND